MEILLKTKQSGNPQFSFLNQDDPLYRYYRHVLMAIKTGRFHIQEEQVKTGEFVLKILLPPGLLVILELSCYFSQDFF